MPPGGEFAWEAFWRLNGDRPYSVSGYSIPMGGVILPPRPGRIPFTSVNAYADRYEIEGQAFDTFVILIEAMDREYVAWEIQRVKEQVERSKTVNRS